MSPVCCPPPGSSQQYLGQEEYYGGEQYGHSQAASEPMSQQYYADGEARARAVPEPGHRGGSRPLLSGHSRWTRRPDFCRQSPQRPLARVCLGMRVSAGLVSGHS